MARPKDTFNCNDLIGSLNSGSEESSLPQSLSHKIPSTPQEDLVQSSGFLQTAQYDMPNYIVTSTSSEVGHDGYTEDQSMLYGYISATNYALPSNGVPTNPNPYITMPLVFDENINASDPELPADKDTRIYGDEVDLQNQMSQLSIHYHNGSRIKIFETNEDYKMAIKNDNSSTIRWRAPNLSEVISFLDNPSNAIKANAAAYLQHLCYMDDPNKQRTRTLGGIPPLVRLLSSDSYEVYKNACGALRNLSYGRQNDENKRAIKNAGGITALINLLCRANETEVKELVTGIIWNMSSSEDLKHCIINDGLNAIVIKVIKPNSGWHPICPGEPYSSVVFRNASGVLRNVSSAGEYARTKLRNCEHFVECLLYVVRTSIEKNIMGTKIVENCVCILRNLSYRCQEVEDPNYDKLYIPPASASSSKSEHLGCFGSSKKKKESSIEPKEKFPISAVGSSSLVPTNLPKKGYEQLWQPDVVNYYLALLQSCSNPETLEAAAGAIQNLSACFWQPSIDIRAAVRKEKGLPILVELLRMEVDRVVCAVATALRNLAIDQRNKELIGKYAMRDLIQKLPSGNPQHDLGTSDETIAAVLATINEVIKKNPEFARSLVDTDGIERIFNISKQRQRYTACVLKFSDQVLYTMWQHNELRDEFKKHGWKEQDFILKNILTRSTGSDSSNNANNTLNRPMASQSRTRYEDKTIRRAPTMPENNVKNGECIFPNDSTALYKRTTNESILDMNDYALQRGNIEYSTMIQNDSNHSKQ